MRYDPGTRRAWCLVSTDLGRVVVLGVLSLGLGWVVNRSRDAPLAWIYRPPSARLASVVPALKPVVGNEQDVPGSPAAPVENVGLE